MENTNPNTAKVQHVTKASSDELLKKFAEVGSESNDKSLAKKELRLAKRVKRSQAAINGGDCSGQGERKSLLPPATSRRPVALIRRLGIGKAKIRAREFKNRSILGTVEKVQATKTGAYATYTSSVSCYRIHCSTSCDSECIDHSDQPQNPKCLRIRRSWRMFSCMENTASMCLRYLNQYANMNRDNDDDFGGDKNAPEKHSHGEFSFAVVQANEVLEDHNQVETSRHATFVGVSDGHDSPDAWRFICDCDDLI